MKSTLIIISMGLILMSCKKEPEFESRFFQIKTINAINNEPMPEVSFSIMNNSSVVLQETTNEFGFYTGQYNAAEDRDCSLGLTNHSGFHADSYSYSLNRDSMSIIEANLLPLSTLNISLSCLNGWQINSDGLSWEMVNPMSGEYSSMYYTLPGSEYVNCGYTVYPKTLASTDWILTYEKRPNSTYNWTEVRDTISLEMGETFYYTIFL